MAPAVSDDYAGMGVDLPPDAESLDFGQRMDLIQLPITKDVVLTKHALRSVQRKWQNFCNKERKGDWLDVLKNGCTRGTCMHFLKFIVETLRPRKGEKPKQSSVHEYWKKFMTLYKRATGRRLDTNDTESVLAFLKGPLTKQYGLDKSTTPKPVLSEEDNATLLEYHWAVDTSVFADEKQRLYVPAGWLFCRYTGCRPAEITDGELSEEAVKELNNWQPGQEEPINWAKEFGFDTSPDRKERCKALCYEDVTLMLVRDPDHGGRTTLLMEVLLSHHKGMDNYPKPVYFPIPPCEDPMFCLVTHFVALAVSDGAFKDPNLTSVDGVYKLRVEGPVQCLPLQWKPEMLKVPVFRQPVRTKDGFRTSKSIPLTSQQFGFYLARLGTAVGLKERLTWYCGRRSVANALIEGAPIPIREQALRHKHGSDVIHSYLNGRTNFDIQALVRGRQARTGLVKLFSHMGLHRDPRAPTRMPDEMYDALPPDPQIVELETEKERLRRKLKAGKTIKAQRQAGSELVKTYDKLAASINAARVQRRKEMDQRYRDEYFENRPSEDIARQFSGESAPEYVEPVIKHQIEERNELLKIFFDKRESLSFEQITERQRRAAGLLRQLCCRREVQRHYRRANKPKRPRANQPGRRCHSESQLVVKIAEPAIKLEDGLQDLRQLPERRPPPRRRTAQGAFDPFPMKCKKTQCPICIGDESLSYGQRVFRYSRRSKMMDHVERHLRHFKSGEEIPCVHPKCRAAGVVLQHVMHYKRHVHDAHGIELRS